MCFRGIHHSKTDFGVKIGNSREPGELSRVVFRKNFSFKIYAGN